MPPVIIAKDLYKCYPGFPPVLRGVNIEVRPGEMVAIMGPSGCGKSTMLHILGLLHAPDSGMLDILGQDMLALNSAAVSDFRRENLGFVMQASNLFEHSTVFENVEFPLIYSNVPPEERWERVIRALDLVGLSSRVHYRSNRLSGGEQQRVAIARAMVNNPRILLADEPTGALDARTSRLIMENFRSLCHKGGVAMVMVTHDPKMAEYCDSVYTLEDGSLHCQKHEPPEISITDTAGFLKPPQPLVRGALVAWRFPPLATPSIMELAKRMHGQGLLSRIYALTRNGVFSGHGGYSLPLPILHMGLRQRLFGGRRQDSGTVRQLRQELPPARSLRRIFWRRRAFSSGSVLAAWCVSDDIQFLYAAGARKVAAAVWVAAKLLKLPFAFAVRAEDLPLLGADCLVRARDAAFITCSTSAIATAFKKFAPDIAPDKVLVLPSLPLYASGEEEGEAIMPAQPGKPVQLLAMSPMSGRSSFAALLGAAKILRRKSLRFRLTVLGKAGLCVRWRIWMAGLGKQTAFAGNVAEDNLAESFRSADIFICWPQAGKGMELALPWPLCEAMSFGKPVIALGISPGMDLLKNDKNCLLAHDAASLARQISNLASNSSLAARLGAAAKRDIRASLDMTGANRLLADRMVAAVGQKEQSGQDGL